MFAPDKKYETEEEEAKRKSIFNGHLKKIAEHNALHAKGKKSYRLGINEYADLVRNSTVLTTNRVYTCLYNL